jgi:hypothetical protein
MKDPFKIPNWQALNFIPPPPPPPTLTVDVGEFVALRTIVMVMLSLAADQVEKSGGPRAQRWINNIAEVASEAIKNSSITDGNGRELDRLKISAAEHVNRILSGIKLPKIDDAN